jgi:phosphohistidine phosphatase SixA
MPLLLVRHAQAGDRTEWEGPDDERPLDERGQRQARELVERLAAYRIDTILTSPSLRCVQTVVPLARARDLPLELREELGEERQADEGAVLVRSLAGRDAVVCGHGGLEQAVPSAPRWKKGAVLVLGPELELVETLKPSR